MKTLDHPNIVKLFQVSSSNELEIHSCSQSKKNEGATPSPGRFSPNPVVLRLIVMFVLTTGMALLLFCHLSKAGVLRVEHIPMLINANKISHALPDYTGRKWLIPLLVMILEEVGGWIHQIRSWRGSLLKETKLKLEALPCKFGTVIVNVGAHLMNVRLQIFHPIHHQIHMVLPVNLMGCKCIAWCSLWENIPFCLILMNTSLVWCKPGWATLWHL